MPREEVDPRNIVSSKCVPCIAPCLLDLLNSADAANATQISQTSTEDPLPAPALPLKQAAGTNEIGGGHGKTFPDLIPVVYFTPCFILAAKWACSMASTTGTTMPQSQYSPTIEEVEDEDRFIPALGRRDCNFTSHSNYLPSLPPTKTTNYHSK